MDASIRQLTWAKEQVGLIITSLLTAAAAAAAAVK